MSSADSEAEMAAPIRYSYAPFLTSENNIVVLVGAGASHDLGIPMGEKLSEAVAELVPRSIESSSSTHPQAAALWQLLRSRIADNDLEKWLTELAGLRDSTSIISGVTAGGASLVVSSSMPMMSGGGSNAPVLREAPFLFKCVCAATRDVIQGAVQDDREFRTRAGELYRSLVEDVMRHNGGGRFLIFTTNYDNAIDAFADSEAPHCAFVDGFTSGDTQRWDPRIFGRPSGPKCIFQMKLHGSVNFYRDQKGSVFKVSRSPVTSIELKAGDEGLLYPTQTKAISADPYTVYYGYLGESLRYARRFISIGYSYGDDHLRAQVVNALRTNGRDIRALVVGEFKKGNPFDGYGDRITILSPRTHPFSRGDTGQPLRDEVKKFLEGV